MDSAIRVRRARCARQSVKPHVANCEWLETNGLGGFASSTIPGMNTRRYHGSADGRDQAAGRPHGAALQAGGDADRSAGSATIFRANRYPGGDSSRGLPLPAASSGSIHFRCSSYEVEGVGDREARLHGARGEHHGGGVRTARRGLAACALELRPLIAFRDYHPPRIANDAIRTRISKGAPAWWSCGRTRICPTCTWRTSASRWQRDRRLVPQFRVRRGTRARARFPGRPLQSAGAAVCDGGRTACVIASTVAAHAG